MRVACTSSGPINNNNRHRHHRNTIAIISVAALSLSSCHIKTKATTTTTPPTPHELDHRFVGIFRHRRFQNTNTRALTQFPAFIYLLFCVFFSASLRFVPSAAHQPHSVYVCLCVSVERLCALLWWRRRRQQHIHTFDGGMSRKWNHARVGVYNSQGLCFVSTHSLP